MKNQNGMPLVSITICTYNGEKYLQQTLESVYRQSYAAIEIVIVDDGSTDGTRDILIAAEKQDSRVRCFFQQNRGLPAARNEAFRKSTGEWLAIIDQDDLCYPTRIEEQVKNSRENPLADLIFCNTDYIDENDVVIGSHLDHFTLPNSYLRKGEAANMLLRLGCFIDSESFFFRKSTFDRIGPLDESLFYACDFDYFIRIGFEADFSLAPVKLGAWRIHSSQATRTNTKKHFEFIRVFKRYLTHPDVDFATKCNLLFRILKSTLWGYWNSLKQSRMK